MNFITKQFNKKEYTLVEELTGFGQNTIYHFIGDVDELFCYLKNKEYIVITDRELIKQIQEELYGQIDGIYFKENDFLKFIEVFKKTKRKITDKEHRDFLTEQINLLKTLGKINEEFFTKRLQCIKIYGANKKTMGRYIGFYDIGEDAIYLFDKDVQGKGINERRTRLHETIHALIAPEKNALLDQIAGRGLVEGATERTVERVFEEKKRKINLFYNRAVCALSKECAYKSAVCIVKQIEFIMRKDITDFALDGNSQIFLDFSELYGKDLFRYIKCKTDRLINPNIGIKKELKILKELQKNILTNVFDKEFKKVDSLESAEEYMKTLSDFQETQAYIIGDDSFENYYCNKMREIIELLMYKRIDNDEISSFIQKYRYNSWINIHELPEKAKQKFLRINIQKQQMANLAKRIRISQIKKRYREITNLNQESENINNTFAR